MGRNRSGLRNLTIGGHGARVGITPDFAPPAWKYYRATIARIPIAEPFAGSSALKTFAQGVAPEAAGRHSSDRTSDPDAVLQQTVGVRTRQLRGAIRKPSTSSFRLLVLGFCLVAFPSLHDAGAARAAVGLLGPPRCLSTETQSRVCHRVNSASHGEDTALWGAQDLVTTRDGDWVYVIGRVSDAITTLRRAPGRLSLRQCLTSRLRTRDCTAIQGATPGGFGTGLNRPVAVEMTADERFLYVATTSTIVIFQRASGGLLSYEGCLTGDAEFTRGCELSPTSDEGWGRTGLSGIRGLTVSRDGRFLYAATSGDAAVTQFARDPEDGSLTFLGCVSGKRGLEGICTLSPGATRRGGNRSGFQGLKKPVLSPDPAQRSLYVAGTGDSSIVQLRRDPSTGELNFANCVTGDSTVEACRMPRNRSGFANDFQGAGPLAISYDGDSLYAVNGSAIFVFRVGETRGFLRPTSCLIGHKHAVSFCTPIRFAPIGTQQPSPLLRPTDIVVGPEDRTVYVVTGGSATVSSFQRTTPGSLSLRSCWTGLTIVPGCRNTPGATQGGSNTGLNALAGVAVSRTALYTASTGDAAVSYFRRFSSP